ncbi:MAG: hypothetical protein FVQ82_17235 [Planctomycetes bacterium]|nr:hypothetical protein [Planctomycetota bacterium]
MDRLIGYMLTWPTYGSWLQGDERGFVKDGVSYKADSRLLRANIKLRQKPAVKLLLKHTQIIRDEFYLTAEKIGQKIYSLAVCSNHIHIVAENADIEIADAVSRYKNNTSHVMRKSGFEGKVWAKGCDKRFCYDDDKLQALIEYVQRHFEG